MLRANAERSTGRIVMPPPPEAIGPQAIPFDALLLDRLMAEAGMDALLVTSKHNVQYMLGGHRALFFDYMDAMGVSRYLPVLIYVRGATDKAAYVAHRLERNQLDLRPIWVPEVSTTVSGSGSCSISGRLVWMNESQTCCQMRSG